jgi:acetyl/propionyl-CoA carboxylase alpha subunit/acetyl-CoA carboxylase carboxyltransferase component
MSDEATSRAPIRRLAIVNRGEAAMRCIRAVKALRAMEGSRLECVALYTDVDLGAPFVRYADRAVRIHSESGAVAAYLDHDGVIEALRSVGADAVWPGWGFLAEDPVFVDRVRDAGIRFLGPDADVMRKVGDKIGAKRLAEKTGVPVTAWSGGPVADVAEATAWAEKIGYPVVVKATSGGGGRGIRIVDDPEDLPEAFRSAASEAKSAFGDPTLFIEAKLDRGRHIEVQIAADSHGNVMALGCRDCSVQRRHQKILEEAPPSGLAAALANGLQSAAVELARAVGYEGVGTVEFLVAGDAYFFLEVNPRLQVEHGITEEVAGIDLVQLQIRIARGEALPELPPPTGRFAIEARVCAEDPEADFLPAPGRVAHFDPSLGPRLRVDSGVAPGCDVPPDFDSLVAKVIAVGDTREEARARLACALTDFELVLEGGATNKGYLIDLLDSEVFRAGTADTGWLDRTPALREGSDELAAEAMVSAAIIAYQRTRRAALRRFFTDPSNLTPASIPPSTGQRIDLSYHGRSYRLEVFAVGAWRYRVHLDGRVAQATLRSEGPRASTLELGGRSLRVLHDASERGLRVEVEGRPYRFGSELAGQVRAGTPAVVIALHVTPGDRVESGQPLGLLEAMKMEIGFQAPVSGVVKELCVSPGQQVGVEELLLVIDNSGEEGGDAETQAPVEIPSAPDPLDLFFAEPLADALPAPDLIAADAAPREARRIAMEAARDEIRRVILGYDVNPVRVEKLAAILEAPLPDGLSETFRWELAEIRTELTLFADVERLFVRAPESTFSGDVGPSNHARLRHYVRRIGARGDGMAPEFLEVLQQALSHYGVHDLDHDSALERAVLRLLSSQLAPELRRRLVLGIIRRVRALAGSGIHLGDDHALERALNATASMRGTVPDALADLATEAAYAIFEGPKVESQAERTTKAVESWLQAAETRASQPPSEVLAHLAVAPRNVFDRVGHWLEDPDERRRAVAVAAHVCRLYAPASLAVHTSSVLGDVHVERLDLADGRTVLGSLATPDELVAVLRRLSRASRAARRGGVHSIELLVPGGEDADLSVMREELLPALTQGIPAERLVLTRLLDDGAIVHQTFARHAPGNGTNGESNGANGGMREQEGLHGIHPETAHRIDLQRLAAFEIERLEAPDDIYLFHGRSPDVPGDERMFVLADVRGRSPEVGHEANLHVPAFERAFFDATRSLRAALGVRDPRRRLQWNRIVLFVAPEIFVDGALAQRLARRLAPTTRHLGLEKVLVRLNVLNRDHPTQPAKPVEIVITDVTGAHMELSLREVHHDALHPARDYERKVVDARRRRLIYPYEIIRMLTGGAGQNGMREGAPSLPSGIFEEYELDENTDHPRAVSAGDRPPGLNPSSVVFGIIDTPTDEVPEGLRRVLILSDPTRGMGSLAAPECDRIVAAIDLAEERSLPVEWVPVSSGARIAMDSGTENLDATARVVRRIITFTQSDGVIHIIVHGVNVGAQSYWNALATMLQHTKGALIMTTGGSMVLTGRAALEASGSVSAEDETAIGGFERIMGPNGEAQYFARDLLDAYRVLYEHYRYTYVPAGESGPRSIDSSDDATRRITDFACDSDVDHDFSRIGEIFDPETNADRKRPFSMRSLMQALIDHDAGHLERWRPMQGAETAIVWDTRLGGRPVCLIGIESRNVRREGYHPSDGPSSWSGGTLFPLSSKKLARALNAASGVRPAVILANLSGFDGSPESMRKLQLEYGAEIARAVVNFEGPLLFMVVSRYHGGAYVVFSRALNDSLRASALEGSFASVIGGAPAASVVFTREVRARASADERVVAMRRSNGARIGADARAEFERGWQEVLLEKQAELASEFDAIHSVERAREVGSLEGIVAPEDLRETLIRQLSESDEG